MNNYNEIPTIWTGKINYKPFKHVDEILLTITADGGLSDGRF